MDPRSGELFSLRHDAEPGEKLQASFAERLRSLTDDEKRALEKLGHGDELIAVSDTVAHQQAVGVRELERRRKRRRGLKGIAGA